MNIYFEHSFLIIMLAGVCFFMMGLGHVTQGLNEVYGNRIHSLMQKIAKSYPISVGVGFALTVLSQSSGAVTSMLVRLGSAGVLTLKEVMGVIVGSAVGSTIIVLLFTFKVADYGLPLIIISFLISYFTERNKVKYAMQIFTGLGFVFFGIELIGYGGEGFLQLPHFNEIASYVKGQQIVLLAASAIFCALVQSSAVAIGFAMGLAQAGVFGLNETLVWVVGANVGTTSVAILASIGGNYVGKRVAWAHFLYRIVSATLAYLSLPYLIPWLLSFGVSTFQMTANFHLGLNLVAALLLSPFYRLGIRFIEFCIPKEKSDDEFGPKFLDRENYQSATMTISYAEREMMRLSEIVLSMVRDGLKIFEDFDSEIVDSLRERDSMVDLLYREIKMFLAKDVPTAGSDTYNKTLKLIFFADDLERAGDVVDGALIDLARKKHDLKLDFSDEGWAELTSFHRELLRLSSLASQQFFYPELKSDVQEARKAFRKTEMQVRESHIERLNEGLSESIKTSSIHLDVLSEFGRIAALMTRHRKYQ